MATLVQFLAAGVNGAASGTATFTLRGTSSSALSVMYSDFEATTQPASNVITLDANGAAEVYCDAYCDVELKNSAGTTLRTVTIGNSAPLVEVQSASFTGTDYDNSPANTAGEPITLKALLDKWLTSAGAVDWKVLFNGSATNLSTALAGFAGMFINVKDPAYGAVGNGVTNDTTAIMAAIAAAQTAGGAIVFFPPGTYQVTNLDPSVVDVWLMGCGEEASILRSNSATTNLLKFTDNTAASSKRISSLGFAATAAHESFIDIEESQQLTIDNCKFDGTNVTDGCIRRLDVDGEANVTITNCKFVDIEGDSAIQNLSDDGESFISVDSCLFVLASGFVGNTIDGPDFAISTSKFDGSAVTSGTYYHYDPSSNETAGKKLGSIANCFFYDGGSSGSAIRLTSCVSGSRFLESANTFLGYEAPSLGSDGRVYSFSTAGTYDEDSHIVLGSRAGKQISAVNSTESELPGIDAHLVAETVFVSHTNASNLEIRAGREMPIGARWTIIVQNNTASVRDITFGGSDSIESTVSAVPVGDCAFARYETFLEADGGTLETILTGTINT